MMVYNRKNLKEDSKVMTPTVEKPCIRRCCLNDKDICMGCFRAFNDMLIWNKSTTEEKLLMLKKAEERKKKHAINPRA